MPGEPVLIDTAALLALVNADDALHQRTAAEYRRLSAAKAPLIVTEWVLAEFLNGASRPPLRAAAAALTAALRSSARVALIPATHEHWDRTFALYTSRPDKEWSFVDCASMLVCEDRRIRAVLTHDRHFEQAGYQVLLR